jgi:hypothetical protein
MGVVLLSGSFIIALALLSHAPGDPSFFSQGEPGPSRNLVGHTGATVAESLFQLFGLGSWS